MVRESWSIPYRSARIPSVGVDDRLNHHSSDVWPPTVWSHADDIEMIPEMRWPRLCAHWNQFKRSVDQSVVVESLINESLDDIHDVDLGAIGRLDMRPLCGG